MKKRVPPALILFFTAPIMYTTNPVFLLFLWLIALFVRKRVLREQASGSITNT